MSAKRRIRSAFERSGVQIFGPEDEIPTSTLKAKPNVQIYCGLRPSQIAVPLPNQPMQSASYHDIMDCDLSTGDNIMSSASLTAAAMANVPDAPDNMAMDWTANENWSPPESPQKIRRTVLEDDCIAIASDTEDIFEVCNSNIAINIEDLCNSACRAAVILYLLMSLLI